MLAFEWCPLRSEYETYIINDGLLYFSSINAWSQWVRLHFMLCIAFWKLASSFLGSMLKCECKYKMKKTKKIKKKKSCSIWCGYRFHTFFDEHIMHNIAYAYHFQWWRMTFIFSSKNSLYLFCLVMPKQHKTLSWKWQISTKN